MTDRCCTIWPTGECCDQAGVVVDERRGDYVCHLHADPGPRQRAAIAATIRQA